MSPAVTLEAQTILSKPEEADTVHLAHQDPETVPHSALEVSWMSMAMEKTRSIQQLLTSRLPRDFTTMQVTSRPQTQAQPTNQAQTVTQSQAANITQVQTTTLKEQHSSLQLPEALQSSLETEKQLVIQTASPAQPLPTVSMVQQRASTQSTSQFLAQSTPSSSQLPTTRSNHGLRSATQPRSSTSAQALVSSYTPSTTAAQIPASGRGEGTTVIQGKGEGPSLSEKRSVSVGERAAFLQKQTEMTTPSGNKVVYHYSKC